MAFAVIFIILISEKIFLVMIPFPVIRLKNIKIYSSAKYNHCAGKRNYFNITVYTLSLYL